MIVALCIDDENAFLSFVGHYPAQESLMFLVLCT